jgi:hypothetical protein
VALVINRPQGNPSHQCTWPLVTQPAVIHGCLTATCWKFFHSMLASAPHAGGHALCLYSAGHGCRCSRGTTTTLGQTFKGCPAPEGGGKQQLRPDQCRSGAFFRLTKVRLLLRVLRLSAGCLLNVTVCLFVCLLHCMRVWGKLWAEMWVLLRYLLPNGVPC